MAVPLARRVNAPPPLLALLADGCEHSGERLAQTLGTSRAAIWKAVARLRALGIGIPAPTRRGYRLAHPVELLQEAAIRAAIAPEQAARIESLELPFVADSTNSRLAAVAPPAFGRAKVCLCELQTAGRGRRGRTWLAPFGASIALSIAWASADAARVGPALSLAVGVAVARALERCGAEGVRLKWPNDVWHADRKLGGILVELTAEACGPAHLVVGIGLNLFLPQEARRQLDDAGACAGAIADACDTVPSRNAVAGTVIDEVLRSLPQFEAHGLAAFIDEWTRHDALAGRPVRLEAGTQVFEGVARGVDADGALLLESAGGLRRHVAGEASLRPLGGGR